MTGNWRRLDGFLMIFTACPAHSGYAVTGETIGGRLFQATAKIAVPDFNNMKKIIRTRTITKTSRQLIVCHENSAATNENPASAPVYCPNCGEPLLPPENSTAGADGALEITDAI